MDKLLTGYAVVSRWDCNKKTHVREKESDLSLAVSSIRKATKPPASFSTAIRISFPLFLHDASVSWSAAMLNAAHHQSGPRW
jgi:hypothetical protein